MRVILVLIGLFSLFINATSGEENPTAPIDALKYYSGDFTDTDGDGMTDVAERKYGYDPLDNTSNPTNDENLWSQILPSDSTLKVKRSFASDSNKIYFKFTSFSGIDTTPHKNFLVKVIPLIQKEMGSPAESFVCTIMRKTNSDGYSTWGGGRSLAFGSDENWRPSSFIHELLHSWKGTTLLNSVGTQWEEGFASGIASVLSNEYLLSYPTDEHSTKLLSRRGKLGNSPYLFHSQESLFDLAKYQQNLSWFGGAEQTYDCYNHAGSFFKLLREHDHQFVSKFNKAFYQKIKSKVKDARGYDSVVDTIASIIPTINNIETKEYISSVAMFDKRKTNTGFHAVLNRRGYANYTPSIYAGYERGGKLDWYSYEEIEEIPTYVKPNGQIVADLRNQPFQVDVYNANEVRVDVFEGKTNNSSNSDGSPKGRHGVKFPKLKPSNFSQGLYYANVTFTNFTHTVSNPSSIYYFFGKQDLMPTIKSNFTLMVGIDSHSLINEYLDKCTIALNGFQYEVPFVNNCAFFNLPDVPLNFSGEIIIEASVRNNESKNVYVRTITNGGSSDGYRHHCFLIIDEDFDGIEDAHDDDVIDLKEWWLEQIELAKSGAIGADEATTSESVQPITVQVETDNSVVIVDDVTAVELTNDNTTIINTTDNVILVQNTHNVTEYEETNSSLTEEDNILVIDDGNITLYTNTNDVYETNATESVVVIGDDTITIEDDTSKQVEFGGDAPSIPSELPNIWTNAISMGYNWYYLEWFGYFYKVDGNAWIFHTEFGWFYTDVTTSFESVWLWSETFGWVWTNKDYFPYVYNSYTSTWFYLTKGGYYDFNLDQWVASDF